MDRCTVYLFCTLAKSQRSSGPCDFLEPYTCGACGIQFQFYNNLLEHMQSHAGESTTTDACWVQQRKQIQNVNTPSVAAVHVKVHKIPRNF